MFVKSSKQRLQEDQSYSKAIKSFTKSLKIISTSKKGTFERSLFTFSKEQSGPKSKNKKGKLITVQSTALARRKFKHRGRSVAPLGRKRVDQKKRKQMNVNEENESVWHTLPAQKKKKSKHPHSLNASVVANRAGEKKH